jgi:enterochelin esterase-like enzyme
MRPYVQGQARHSPVLSWAATLSLALGFLIVGFLGAYRYVDGFWLYRGFPPPRDPAYVRVQGTEQTIYVQSRALGGRKQQVVVYLPPGYALSRQRYPVLYLLHGFPGNPSGVLQTLRMGVLVDSLMAKGHIRGVILVAPMGSTGTFTDKEWANGVRPNEAWETFVARDVVNAIDARYRTVHAGAGRAIAGLSEGGYGALNIALHHPGEFRVIESWSGYMLADNIPSIFGRRPALLAYNSPAIYLPRVAQALRRNRTFVWFYTGSKDTLLRQNRAFAAELGRNRIPNVFFVDPGGHTWKIWRGNAEAALLAATTRMRGG